jgi:hypothetical protein
MPMRDSAVAAETTSETVTNESSRGGISSEDITSATSSQYNTFSNVSSVNPIYITIGPPCAGKTTWIAQAATTTDQDVGDDATASHSSNHQNSSKISTRTATTTIQDISLDDQMGVYHALPCRYFLDPEIILQKQQQQEQEKHRNINNSDTKNQESEDIAILQTVFYGKTIVQRIQEHEQLELRLVLQRINQKITASQFASALTDAMSVTHHSDDIKRTIVTEYISVMEEELILLHTQDSTTNTTTEHSMLVPKTVDLFVREAIFRPDAVNSTTALERAYDALRFAITNDNTTAAVAVAWGNTNTKPSDYKFALQMAAETNRPVYFVVYKDDLTITRLKERNPNATEARSGSNTREVDRKYKRCNDTVLNQYDHDTFNDKKKDGEEIEDPGMVIFEDDVFDLFAENFRELLHRNLQRFFHSGRYVPATVIWDMRIRTAESVRRVVDMWKHERLDRSQRMTKLEFHQCLARMINFEMSNDRTVRPIELPIPAKKPRRDENPRLHGNTYDQTDERNQRMGNYRNISRASTG